MKKILIILCISYIAHSSSFANDISSCDTLSWYDLYNCRLEKICQPYENGEKVYVTQEFEEASTYLNILDSDANAADIVFEEAKEIYRNNIWNIYSCAMIKTQEHSLELIDEELLDFVESWELGDIMTRRIESRENRLTAASETLSCSDSSNGVIYNKQDILDQVSQQACTYITYLEYLREYYSSIPNILWLDTNNPTDTDWDGITDIAAVQETFTTSWISQLIQWFNTKIEREIDHTYKVFPIAFRAYTQYENHYPIHFLLEVIREDFMILRRKIHESLMPIAQVGYKIINAMIK